VPTQNPDRYRRAAAPAGLVLLAAALAIALAMLAAPFGALAPHRIDPGEARWMTATHALPDLKPRRPMVGQATPSLSALPAGDAPVQVFHRFDLDEPADGPEALLVPALSGQLRLYVNGAPIFTPPEVSRPLSAAPPGARSLLIRIPPEYYSPGPNRLDIAIHEQTGRAVSAGLYAGPAAPLARANARIGAAASAAGAVTAPLAALAALSCLAAALAGAARARFLWAAGAALSLTALTAAASPPVIDALGPYWLSLFRAVTATLMLTATLAVTAGAVSTPRAAWRAALAGSALPIGAAAALAASQPAAAWWLGLAGLVPAAALAALRLPRVLADRLRGGGMADASEAALGLLAAILVAALLAGAALQPLSAWLLLAEFAVQLAASGLVAAGLAAATVVLVRRAIRLARDRADLARVVTRQRQELDAKSRVLEEEMRRRAVLEERQRLVRDMHDGIGGQLLSLLARVRTGKVGLKQVEGDLLDGLNDLRLIVDSLDTAGDSLSEALTAFRVRAREQVETAGLGFDWRQDGDLDLAVNNPRWVLNIYRFLQEAVTNAVRHSGGDRVAVSVARSNDTLRVSIADNGAGMPDPAPEAGGNGKGLGTMRERAKLAGGSIAFEPGPEGRGTRVTLTAPISPGG